MNLPRAARCLAQIGIAGQAATTEHHPGFIVQRPGGQRRTAALDPALWRVAHAADVRVARCRHHTFDGHLRASQGAGFVRANDRS